MKEIPTSFTLQDFQACTIVEWVEEVASDGGTAEAVALYVGRTHSDFVKTVRVFQADIKLLEKEITRRNKGG